MGEKKKAGGMARRGKEIQLQEPIDTQVEWDDMLSKEGLCVVDVYQEWPGPVKPLLAGLRRLKIELSDDLLKFAVAKADTIDSLEKYRGKCEPCFLFFAGGVLVAVVRGANAPLIQRTITEQLAQEHKVLDGQAERKEIKDVVIAQLEADEKAKTDEEEREKEEEAHRLRFHGEIIDFGDELSPRSEKKKEVTVAIIKPDAVQSGKAEEIMGEMAARGIEILRQEERHLTEEEVRTLYSHLQDEEYFEDIVKFMSSSPSIVLAVTKGKTGENIIQEFRDLIGPPVMDEAKEQAPESLRAKYGSDTVQNAVHAADSHETAIRELAFFFPDFVAPTVEGKRKLQRTLALIRPDAYKAHKDEIISKIRESGFRIAMKKEVHLSKEQAEDFYSEHKDQEYFDELTTRMSSGPLLALGLARHDAVEGWREMLGPTAVEDAKEQAPDSLRAKFAVEGTPINMLHGSSTEEQANKEIEYFFPIEQTVAVIKPDAYQTKDEIIDKIHEAGFRIAARKETTLSKEIAEEFYKDHKDKEYYEDLVTQMSSGPTYFMVLSSAGAVDGWRTMIGETDPGKAKEVDPESIRGQFGTDILKNAVHGSSNVKHAMSTIQQIFGELYFNPDGTVQDEEEEEEQAIKVRKPKTLSGGKKRQSQSDTEPHDRPPVTTSSSRERHTKSEADMEVSAGERPGSASAIAFGGYTQSPALEIHSVPDIDPDEIEAMLADQENISYEPTPDDDNAMLAEQREQSYEPAPEFDSEQERKEEEKQEEKQITQEQQVKEETQEPQKTEQVEGEKEPEAQVEPEPQQEQEKVKSPEPQQETEEKKEEQEPKKESTDEGDAQQQQEQDKEEVKEEPKQEETTQEETKEEPTQQQEVSQENQQQEVSQENQQHEVSQETQQEPEPEPAQTSEEQTEQKTETTEEPTEQKTEEQKTEEQKTEETADQKKEDAS